MRCYLLFIFCVHRGFASLTVRTAWKTVDFNFEPSTPREELLECGAFIPVNVLPVDVDVYKSGTWNEKIFVTTPSLKPGVPFTLSRLMLDGRLCPYPSWSWHDEIDCSKMISVMRIAIDDCNRLWVLDTGRRSAENYPNMFVCPPKLMIFNLENDRLVGSYELPEGVFSQERSFLAGIVVDSRRCDNSFAFLSDVRDYKIVVFKLETQEFWRWNHSALFPVPPHDQFSIDGVNFALNDGFLALAYYPKNGLLYFNGFASVNQSSVSATFLRQMGKSNDNDSVTTYDGTRGSPVTSHAMSTDGILFYSPVSESAIRCWDVTTPFTKSNQPVVAEDDESLHFLTSNKIRDDRYWAVSTRFQNFQVGRVSPVEINYRIVTATVRELIRGTSCDYRQNWPKLFRRLVFGF